MGQAAMGFHPIVVSPTPNNTPSNTRLNWLRPTTATSVGTLVGGVPFMNV